MFLLYVDESGDPGLTNSPTRYFGLSGLMIHETHWHEFVRETLRFRRLLRQRYGIRVRHEIHTSDFIRSTYRTPDGTCLCANDRILVLRDYVQFLASLSCLRITSVMIDKTSKPEGYDVFGEAWRLLFQSFEQALKQGDSRDYGMTFCDKTNGAKLVSLMRKMTLSNPVATHGGGLTNMPIRRIIEDPNMRDSEHSLLIQSADVVAYLLLQHFSPNKMIRKYGAKNFFKRLKPVCLDRDNLGIVMK
jgi:hypothetical protein